jgi:hypothetical protein
MIHPARSASKRIALCDPKFGFKNLNNFSSTLCHRVHNAGPIIDAIETAEMRAEC